MTLRFAPAGADPEVWSRGVVLDCAAGTVEATVGALAPGRRFSRPGRGVLGFGPWSLAGVRFVCEDEDRMIVVFLGRFCLALGWHLHYPGGVA